MMEKRRKTLYAIYKYSFHKSVQRTVTAEAAGVDGSKYLQAALTCFASLFDQNSIDHLSKMHKKGEATQLPNDVMAKAGDIIFWRVNNSQMKEWWKRSGKDSAGYHYYITRDGHVWQTRHEQLVGAHARGYNSHSLGVCYEGGLDPQGKPADTRTEQQKKAMLALLTQLTKAHPGARIVGHRDLPGVHKACPCFDCSEYDNLQQPDKKNQAAVLQIDE